MQAELDDLLRYGAEELFAEAAEQEERAKLAEQDAGANGSPAAGPGELPRVSAEAWLQ